MMTSSSNPVGIDRPVTPVLAELAHVLVSEDRVEERLHRALELLRRIVPYDQCALVETDPNAGPHVHLHPEPSQSDEAAIEPALLRLLGLVSEFGAWKGTLGDGEGPPEREAWGSSLAVPLVGSDGVDGLLLVSQRVADAYGEDDLRLLSIVAAQIAAYLMACRQRTRWARLADRRTARPDVHRESDEHAQSVLIQTDGTRLTNRQMEVARLIAAGRSNAQIARELVLTKGTVANHIEHILRRLDASNRAQVAAWVVERELLSREMQR